VPQITLVSNQHNHNVRIGMVSQLFQPSRHVVVCLVFANVVNEQCADSAPVVGRCDRSVSFLTCGVPNLCLDGLGVDLNRPGCEFDADGRLGVEIELVSSKSTEKVGFTDARITDQHDCSWLVEHERGMTAQSTTFEQELYSISRRA